jgi:pilus assembly protein FimV
MEGGVWDEAATKLDLGRAYVEMNDRQEAEALLLEVVEEGNLAQQAEARELLARLKLN